MSSNSISVRNTVATQAVLDNTTNPIKMIDTCAH